VLGNKYLYLGTYGEQSRAHTISILSISLTRIYSCRMSQHGLS
jgi:hypothetical protein